MKLTPSALSDRRSSRPKYKLKSKATPTKTQESYKQYFRDTSSKQEFKYFEEPTNLRQFEKKRNTLVVEKKDHQIYGNQSMDFQKKRNTVVVEKKDH